MSRFWEIGKQIRIPQRSPDLVRYTGLCQHVMTCGFKELLGQWTSISFQCWLCNRLQFIGCPILSDDLVRCGFKIYVGLDMLDWIGLKTGWWFGTWILYFSIYIYILGIFIFPTDFKSIIFQRAWSTTKQIMSDTSSGAHPMGNLGNSPRWSNPLKNGTVTGITHGIADFYLSYIYIYRYCHHLRLFYFFAIYIYIYVCIHMYMYMYM